MSEETFEHKPAAYLCGGCGIKDALDMDALETAITGGMMVLQCQTVRCILHWRGLETIKADIKSGDVNQAIVAGCSPRVMVQEFNEVGGQVFRANMREQVIWQQPANNEDTQALATDNMRMAITQARKAEPPQAHWDGATSLKLLVVGGGITGLTAAREASKTGAASCHRRKKRQTRRLGWQMEQIHSRNGSLPRATGQSRSRFDQGSRG